MQKGRVFCLLGAGVVLAAVPAQSATLFRDDFAAWLVGDADGKVLPATQKTLSVIAASPAGTWYKDDTGSFFATTNTPLLADQPPADSTGGAAMRVGYFNHNTNYTRVVTIKTGVNYDANTNYTIRFSAKLKSSTGAVPTGAETGQIQLNTGFWNTNTATMSWVKSVNITDLSATSWATNEVVSNGARLSKQSHGQPIIIRFTRNATNSTNFFSWVDFVEIEGIDPYAEWANGFGLSGVRTNDFDGDLIDDFTEFATGGDPTNPNDTGLSGKSFIANEGGTNRFAYITPRQADYWPNGVDYYLEASDSLLFGAWTNAGSWVAGTADGGFNAEFDAITNYVGNVESNATQFLRLRATHPTYNP